MECLRSDVEAGTRLPDAVEAALRTARVRPDTDRRNTPGASRLQE
ncbi:hypothetical protein [Streptomyces cinnamoneus]|uniref:Uncharacterized protein n=1 Tax=Streptomyces cinnamoneus TaxID=53446 RepID=A0A918WQJ6_STRCJ|nr:hypothetical protein [Streptomyces cinnamoneus]GHC67897.1 hypothetical protein GCM10010507_52600 [Streptomyces cinnamoneus]